MEIGEKIKQLRIKNGLTQEELGDRCELTKGYISQLERDLTSPSISTLISILESLGTNIKDFFNENIEEKIVFIKEDIFSKELKDQGCEIHWLISNSQKNLMEPILLQLEGGGSTNTHDPHDGEEFGYVLSGNINLIIGDKKYKVKKGESFYFKPNFIHYITNTTTKTSSLIWICTPPTF